jgi:Tol biopolymer transport system component
VPSDADARNPSVSADGRLVVFQSPATNLVAGDDDGDEDVFVRDLQAGTTRLVSAASDGTPGDAGSSQAVISANGRFVAFQSSATNLVSPDTRQHGDVFVRDLMDGTNRRVSVNDSGAEGNGSSSSPNISGDGRFIAFVSSATNLVASDTNSMGDVFLRDMQLGTIQRVSVAGDGAEANRSSSSPRVSADGRFVAFVSGATNLQTEEYNNTEDVFVRDVQQGTTQRVNVATSGTAAAASSYAISMSADGRFVAFDSVATNLGGGAGTSVLDVFVRDRTAGTTRFIPVSAINGLAGNLDSAGPAISADGRFVAFVSGASNLVAGDTNGLPDIFVAPAQ